MSNGRQKITFEGLLQKDVLGTFTVIRGFADLHDLALVSKAMPYQPGASGQPTGYQRALDDDHIEGIEKFLTVSPYRFFPEIVLSLRSQGPGDPTAPFKKRRPGTESDLAYRVTVNLKALRADPLGPIHRVDGNHRLEAAQRVYEKQRRTGQVRGFMKAPFCFVVLSDSPDIAELTEAMLFNLINSKALTIASEHSLRVLMRDNRPAHERFAEDPHIYLTRWIHDTVRGWPHGFYDAMGENPLSRLHAAADVLLRPDGISKVAQQDMESEAGQLFGPLYQLAIRLRDQHDEFVHSSAFLPVAAEVYARHSSVNTAKGANTEAERIRRAERWLREFARWFDRVGGAELPLPADPSVLWTVFKRDYDRRAGQVFVAMSFRESRTLDAVYRAIEEAIAQFNAGHPNALLTPVRVDKYQGESFDIPARVFQDIERSCLVIADLTDEKQNVYCEVGYAKARGIPFILTFHKTTAAAAPSNKVHFDLSPYRYIEYEESLELRDKLKAELDAWHARR